MQLTVNIFQHLDCCLCSLRFIYLYIFFLTFLTSVMEISSFSPCIPGENTELLPSSSVASYQHPGAGPQDPGLPTEPTHQQPPQPPSLSQTASSQAQTVPGQQLQARGGSSMMQSGSTQAQPFQGQSPQARGFSELSGLQATPQAMAPGGFQIRSSANDSHEDADPWSMQSDVLKGVSQAVRNAVSDKSSLSEYDHLSVQDRSVSPTTSEPTSLESSMKSVSLVPVKDIDDKVIEEYRHKMPKHLKVDYYDAMILYQEDDKSVVERFLERVNTEVVLQKEHKPLVVLYDQILPSGAGMSPIAELDFILSYCTYVLLYVTKEFCRDGWTEFSSQTCLMEAIHNPDKRWSVVPIFTEPKRSTSFRVPPSVRSLKGIQYWSDDKFYVDSLRKLLEDKLHVRREREAKHKSERKKWIIEEKGREIRAAEKRRQSELHARQEEMARRKQHIRQMQAANNQHQQMLQESDRQFKLMQIQTPEECLQNYGVSGLQPKRDDRYMQSLYQQNPYATTFQFDPNLTPNPMSLPASLDQFEKTFSNRIPHSLRQSYSVPSDVDGSQFFVPTNPSPALEMSYVPGHSVSGSQQVPSGSRVTPQFSLSPQISQGDARFQETASPQQQQPSFRSAASLSSQHSQDQGGASCSPGSVDSLRCTSSPCHQGSPAADQGSPLSFTPLGGLHHNVPGSNPDGRLPSSARELGGFQSMPARAGDTGELSQRRADSQGAAPQSMPARVGTVQPFSLWATAGSVEKEVTDAVQRDVGGLHQQPAKRSVQGHALPSSGQGNVPDALYLPQQLKPEEESTSGVQPQKDDLEGDFPPESHVDQAQRYTAHTHVTKTHHRGQPYLSEAVAEPPLIVQGPGHHTSSRSRAEPFMMGDPQYAHQQQYMAGGPRVSEAAENVPQTLQFPQGLPHVHQPRHPGLHYAGEYRGPQPGYRVYPQYFPTGQAAIPPVFPADLGYTEQYQPRWQPPQPVPPQHYYPGQQQYPEPQLPVVHHHYYHNRSEQVPGATINYIKTAGSVMIGSEISVKEKTSQRPGVDTVERVNNPAGQVGGEAFG